MNKTDENEKWHLPDALRVDLDTDASKQLLEAANAQQAELAARFGGPFQASTPQSKLRARAAVIVQEYDAIGIANLTPEQKAEYAEMAAALGHFGIAAAITPDASRSSEFQRFGRAIVMDDDIDCGHGDRNKVAEAEVFSLKHNADVVLVRCTRCQDVNAIPLPKFMQSARSRRQSIRTKYTGLKPLEARDAMLRDGIKPA